VRCSDADDQPGSREATVVFETGLPGKAHSRRGTTVRFLCEERTPPWKTMGPVEDSHHQEATDCYSRVCKDSDWTSNGE
jgi:hypothetical protein